MADDAQGSQDPAEALPPASESGARSGGVSRWARLRGTVPTWQAVLLGIACLACVAGLWWFVTRGEIVEERIVSRNTLPSPAETFEAFHSLWFEKALTRNTWATLRRVALGFALSIAVGVPLGVLAGCFTRFGSFLAPLLIFGRNIPIAALIPLTIFFFGIQETQKILFIFIATVAFVLSDTVQAVRDVDQRYVDTAYTLGASRWQVIIKVLVPLALPSVFNALRVLFGLAFGYIMLAEVIQVGGEFGGLGHLINISRSRGGTKEHIYLIILLIPVLAFAIDRLLWWIQRETFPHAYGSAGLVNGLIRGLAHGWDDLKALVWKPVEPPGIDETAPHRSSPAGSTEE